MSNTGKEKCELLKRIRSKIALDNNISYVPTDCPNTKCIIGTCPMCDDELKWITEQLKAKSIRGERVVLDTSDLLKNFYG